MRIVLLDPTGFTPPYDHALAAALARRDHDVHLVTSSFRFGDPLPAVGFTRHECLFPLTNRLFQRAPRAQLRHAAQAVDYLPSAVRLLARRRSLAPDIVHVQWLPLPSCDLAWLRLLARRGPTFLTAHDVFPPRGWDLAAWRKALHVVDGIVVLSKRGADALAVFGIDPGRIYVDFHPVFPPGACDVAPPDRERETLLFFGLIRARKGLDVLIQALPRIVKAVPGARLVIAGDPVESAEPLRELAVQLRVASNIEWQLGFLPDETVATALRRASVIVLPYRRGASSGVLATSLGHGLPAVVSDVGALGELVGAFGAGKVVAPGEVEALAEACIELLTDARMWEQAAAGARKAGRELTWDGAAAAHERAYAAAVDRRDAASQTRHRHRPGR